MNNHSQTIIALATFLLMAAIPAQASKTFKDGFYLGGALGAGLGHADWDGISKLTAVNDQGTPLMISESWTPDGDTHATEFAGRVMLGYQFVHKSLYLAAEIGGTFSPEYDFDLNEAKTFMRDAVTPNHGPKTLLGSTQLSDSVTLGGAELNVDLKPGWLISKNFLAYTRVGIAVNKLTIENAGTWTNVSSSYAPYNYDYTLTTKDSSEESDTALGIRLGLGGEYLITQNLGITLDYTYTDYGTISTKAEATGSTEPIFTDILSPFYSVYGIDAPDVKVSTQTVMLGMLYHW